MAVLYKTKVKNLEDRILGQLVRLNNGIDGMMLDILTSEPNAHVYYWEHQRTVISWCCLHKERDEVEQIDNDSFYEPDYVLKDILKLNIYTAKKFRKQGWASELIDHVKKDFMRDCKKKRVYGYGSLTSLVYHKGLMSL